MAIPDTPLFVKTHDFNVWLLKHTLRFPKPLRMSYTGPLETLALEFEETLALANTLRGTDRQQVLAVADAKLLALRLRLRYTLDLKLLAGNQFHYAAQCLDELGRLLGAWRKGANR